MNIFEDFHILDICNTCVYILYVCSLMGMTCSYGCHFSNIYIYNNYKGKDAGHILQTVRIYVTGSLVCIHVYKVQHRQGVHFTISNADLKWPLHKCDILTGPRIANPEKRNVSRTATSNLLYIIRIMVRATDAFSLPCFANSSFHSFSNLQYSKRNSYI